MRVHVVRAVVPDASRERYLAAWEEWSGTLFSMGIRTRLLESDEDPGRFLELTWFDEGEEAAVGDDRLVAAAAELRAAAEVREGASTFYCEVDAASAEGESSPG